MPKLIEYDEETGLPRDAQDVNQLTPKHGDIAILPWGEWLRGRVAQDLDQDATYMAAISLVLNSLHTRGSVAMAQTDVSLDLGKNRKIVTASEDLRPFTLALPPCVPKAAKVYTTSVHPHRVPIVVTEASSAVAEQYRSREPITCIPNTSFQKRAQRSSMMGSRLLFAYGSGKATRHCTLLGYCALIG